MKKVSRNVRRSAKRRNNNPILGIGITILLTIIMIFVFSNNVNGNKYLETKNIVVSSNDTLWTIAKNICDKNESCQLYSVIKDIKDLNDIKDSVIYEGQVLKVFKY